MGNWLDKEVEDHAQGSGWSAAPVRHHRGARWGVPRPSYWPLTFHHGQRAQEGVMMRHELRSRGTIGRTPSIAAAAPRPQRSPGMPCLTRTALPRPYSRCRKVLERWRNAGNVAAAHAETHEQGHPRIQHQSATAHGAPVPGNAVQRRLRCHHNKAASATPSAVCSQPRPGCTPSDAK